MTRVGRYTDICAYFLGVEDCSSTMIFWWNTSLAYLLQINEFIVDPCNVLHTLPCAPSPPMFYIHALVGAYASPWGMGKTKI